MMNKLEYRNQVIRISAKTYHVSQNPIVNDIEHYRNIYQGVHNFIKRRVDYSRMKVYDEKFRKEIERFETFRKFPINLKHLINSLAKSGFYFIGQEGGNDKVKCIYCQGILENWKKNDDPKRRHKFFYPTCPYILNINVANESIPEQLIKNFNEDPDLKLLSQGEIQYRVVKCKIELYLVDFNENDVEKRECSFEKFPHLSTLSISGLFVIHKHYFDYLKCYKCLKEIELLNEVEKLPLEIFHNSDCSLRKDVSNIRYEIKKYPCLVEYPISNDEIEARLDSLKYSKFISNRSEMRSFIKRRLRTTGLDYTSMFEFLRNFKLFHVGDEEVVPETLIDFAVLNHLCVICMDKGVEVIFLPCGHLKTCRLCSTEIKVCPLCRHLIEKKVWGIQLY